MKIDWIFVQSETDNNNLDGPGPAQTNADIQVHYYYCISIFIEYLTDYFIYEFIKIIPIII